jgi:hypothetical protein
MGREKVWRERQGAGDVTRIPGVLTCPPGSAHGTARLCLHVGAAIQIGRLSTKLIVDGSSIYIYIYIQVYRWVAVCTAGCSAPCKNWLPATTGDMQAIFSPGQEQLYPSLLPVPVPLTRLHTILYVDKYTHSLLGRSTVHTDLCAVYRILICSDPRYFWACRIWIRQYLSLFRIRLILQNIMSIN